MSAKLKLASVMVLAAVLAGCGSTKTGSIIPDSGGPVTPDPDPDPGTPDPDPGTPDPDPGTPDPEPQQHSLSGWFYTFSKANTFDGGEEEGTMTVTIPAGDTKLAKVEVSGTTKPVPGGNLGEMSPGLYGTGEDNFLDLNQSGDNYTIGSYVRNDNNNWYVGAAVGTSPDGVMTRQDQITGDATYTGRARGAVIPMGWVEDAQPYEMTGDVGLELNVGATRTTIQGDITNIEIHDDDFPSFAGAIALGEADVVNGKYEGAAAVAMEAPTEGLSAIGAGSYDGALYGANAEETAGKFGVAGVVVPTGATDTNDATGFAVIGSFGAKQ